VYCAAILASASSRLNPRAQPLNLSFLINIDGDHKVEILLLTGLDQQWDDMNHDGAPRRLAPARRPCAMVDAADPPRDPGGERIGENDLTSRVRSRLPR
jgi:hypothetical protein